ncbi:MAG: hypothetical protein H0V05_17010 [Euzebyaceae bacterium]|nr:hypothetical protein [Euzebyaceae bacterium]
MQLVLGRVHVVGGGSPTAGTRRFVVIDGYRADGWQYGPAAGGVAADLVAPLLVVHRDGVTPVTAPLVSTCGAPEVELLLVGPVYEAAAQGLTSRDGEGCG